MQINGFCFECSKERRNHKDQNYRPWFHEHLRDSPNLQDHRHRRLTQSKPVECTDVFLLYELRQTDNCYKSNINPYSQTVAIFICNLHWHLQRNWIVTFFLSTSPKPSINEYVIALHSGFPQTVSNDSALAFG